MLIQWLKYRAGAPPSPTYASGNSPSKWLVRWTIRRTRLIATFFAALCIMPGVSFGAGALEAKVAKVLGKELPPGFLVSLQVVDLASGKTLVERQAHLPLIPASTMKVATSASALAALKPDFCFTTEVLTDALERGTASNLYLRGGGDPHLVTEELFLLTHEVRAGGLAEVRGNIVVDDSMFVPSDPVDEQEELGTRAYHARYSALSLNFNDVKVTVRPGPRAGDPAAVAMDPLSDYASLKADVTTVKGKQPLQMDVERQTSDTGRDTFLVGGTIGDHAAPKARHANVSNPALYTGEVFKEFLLREGVRVTGRVVQGAVPSEAVPYYSFPSKPLGLLVYWQNKFSSNFMAEQINLMMGARVYGFPGTREKGLQVIRKHLLDCGVKEAEFSLTDASGLSKNNRISAAALVRVLISSARDFSYGPEFMASFGVAGVDGTLREKFLNRKRRLRAKTGNVRGVNALAGYGMSSDKRPFVFAVLVNSEQKGGGFIDYAEKIMRRILDVPFGD